MMYVNGLSAIVSAFTLISTQSFVPAINFCGRHPALVLDAAYLSATSVASQYFIYSQVKEFGALVFAATMNVRQVVSIIVSYAKYSHSITKLQVLGLCCVFGALFYKSYASLFAEKGPETKPLADKSKAENEDRNEDRDEQT